MLSLSIGWGIRGNFGASEGATIPGALCALAISLFSGRQDWRERVPFFALFGALGWAFGGAIAYMSPLAYTQSGHLPTQLYGFFGCFAVGFLWASLGGAGTAYAATETYERMTAIFRPLCWVMVLWTVQYFGESTLVSWYAGADFSDFRQLNHFYWLDTSWLTVLLALIALCAFDLWTRKFNKVSILIASCGVGALAGAAAQSALAAIGWLQPLLKLLVHVQGDLSAIDPVTGRPFDPSNLITNWPQIFSDWGPHMGLIIGLAIGIGVYFYRYGEWHSGSLLFVEMAVGSLATFLIGPVLLSNAFTSVGGFRMMPPRADDWALILGALLGLLHYCFTNALKPVAFVAISAGVIGGLGLMLAQFIKILMIMPGNPILTHDPATIQAWSHWHNANWHSIVTEQGVGLLYGLAVVLPMAALAGRIPLKTTAVRVRRWTEVFSCAFVLCVVVYLNLVHNLENWTAVRSGGFASVPETMKAPLFGSIDLSTLSWFNLAFLLYSLCIVSLLTMHIRRKLAVVPLGWLGKGQLLYVLFVWMMVIGNFERIVVVFDERRLATEGTLFVNALIATFVMIIYPREAEPVRVSQQPLRPLLRNSVIGGVAAAIVAAFVFTGIVHAVYGDQRDGWGAHANYRFGPKADWRLRPIQKTREHN